MKQLLYFLKRALSVAIFTLLLVACGSGSEELVAVEEDIVVEEDKAIDNEETDINISIAESTRQLNDTGIILASGAECIAANQQDCTQGRDAQALASTLNKIGAGNAGFDFTKIDHNGIALAAETAEWACVKDNHTGLIWEVKAIEGLHAQGDTYTWYAEDFNNSGPQGLQDNTLAQCFSYDVSNASSYCNTEAFVARVNAEALCGAQDWRLPSRSELLSLVDYGQTVAPAIDTHYFPYTQSTYYWTTSFSARVDEQVWNISFDSGQVSDSPELIIEAITNPQVTKSVRLVRG